MIYLLYQQSKEYVDNLQKQVLESTVTANIFLVLAILLEAL